MLKDYKFDLKKKKIWVAGHNGMVGKAILEKLKNRKLSVLTVKKNDLDLTNQNQTFNWIKANSPQVIFIAAAKVGGILTNSLNQFEFLYQNLMIQSNIIRSAAENNVQKLIFLGSSCIYPKEAKQPIKEEALLCKPLEKTNEGYAIAKIAGLKLCSYLFKEHNKDFITVMPTNLYGPNDNFDLKTSHVLAALINKITNAKKYKKESVEIWGTGKPKRDFLYVNDLADAVCYLAENYSSPEPINVGSSREISIKELAEIIAKQIGWKGSFSFNKSMPDGTMLKKLDTTKISKLGWKPKIDIKTGIKETIKEYEKSL
ncbi:MAG: GDP-fucose synthetase [Pelagibacterales bacterium]|nr:GDP-fucose synthetase [Pelagibacterales bacterium]OUU63232.1 MAG: GDP-fucose synthetase [Alphaproteobacteria bacterium TMED62]|tara:strand:+ start:15266 stop:16210 length:945 start_codon:yes stop_codon:yes gene_type:complete